jgi:putative cardiolipin synthase
MALGRNKIKMKRTFLAIGALCLILVLVGCASLPTDYPRVPSRAFTDTGETRLGRELEPVINGHPGESGVHPLISGTDALAARLLLIDAAERSIDVQYYFIRDDTTGSIFAERLLHAADRGVRVRVLIDDLSAGDDDALIAFDTIPNLEIRVFNPLAERKLRGLDFLTDFPRVNRRMHNKSFIADNQVAIVGGRNIGDEYFEAGPDLDFNDLDLLAVGPVVREVSAAFDAYWNSEQAVPIAALADDGDSADLADLRRELMVLAEEALSSPYAAALSNTAFIENLEEGTLPLYWGEAQVLYDLPEKVTASTNDLGAHLELQLRPILDTARSEIFFISPYFVPGEWGLEYFRILREKQLRIVVITNSLATTDVSVVHAGYAPYRRALLEEGVELYELKPNALNRWRGQSKETETAPVSLHTKAFVVDRGLLFVGSLNLDPRSFQHNTEMGILFEHEELATLFAEGILAELPSDTYRLELVDGGAQPRLEWVEWKPGREVRHRQDPETGFWLRFSIDLLALLPIEGQL